MKIPSDKSAIKTPWAALLLAEGDKLSIFGNKPKVAAPPPQLEMPAPVIPALSEKTEKETYRWAEDAMPLRIYYPADQDWSRILEQWVLGAQQLVTFVRATDPDSADIVVSWTDEAVLGRPYEVGHTKNTVSEQGFITHAEIQLLQKPLIDQQLAAFERQMRLQATVLHEIGHALGLEHSENSRDVMHHQGWENPYLNEHDCQRIYALYRKRRLSGQF